VSAKQLLFLPEDRVASAALEVIRRVLQPTSRALPHITLRYSNRPLRESARPIYETLQITDFVLDQVTSFDKPAPGEGIRTIVLFCDSEQLEHASYRPDHPDSVFHVTLYDGPASLVAERALELLSHYPWRLQFEMDLARFDSSQEAIANSTLQLREGVWFTELAAALCTESLDQLGFSRGVAELDEPQQLALIDLVCGQLHTAADADATPIEAREALRLRDYVASRQLEFWSERDIAALSPSSKWLRGAGVREHSRYITPPELSLDVVDEALKWLDDTALVDFGDPAIGSGIFYAALRHRLGDERINTARGVEIDRFSAQRTLHRWRRTRLSVLLGDFLHQEPERRSWTLLLANPPYRRSQEIGSSLDRVRERLEDELSLEISRRSDLYSLFILRAHAWMNDDAVAAWVIPAEFQVTDYGRALRSYLATRVQLLRIHTYDPSDSQFDNALVSTSVVVFKNRAPEPAARAVITEGGSLAAPTHRRDENVKVLEGRFRWNFAYLQSRDAAVEGHALGDFFSVKRGIATGANSLFVLSSSQVESLKVRAEWIRPLFPRAREIPDGVLRADDSGLPNPSSDRWLIDTDAPLSEIEEISPDFAAYLHRVEIATSASALVRRRRPIYHQERRPAPPIAFVYMAKMEVPAARRFIANHSRATILNNYLGLYPRSFVAAELLADPELLDRLHASFSRLEPNELRSQGRTYGSGLLKLEPREVARISLPPAGDWSRLADG